MRNDSITTAQSPAKLDAERPVRPWRRLHAWTYVVLLLTAAVLFLLNVPGQRTPEFALLAELGRARAVRTGATRVDIDGFIRPLIEVQNRIVHGWPATWLVRNDEDPATGEPRNTSIWSFSEDLRHFFPQWLALNIAVGLALVAAVGLLFERWRRKRRRIWQQTIRDWLVLIAVVGAATAFTLKTARDYQDERAGLSAMGFREPMQKDGFLAVFEALGLITRTSRIPTWFQELLGERRLPWFERTVHLDVSSDRLEQISRFPTLRALRVDDLRLNDEGLAVLSRLKHLELLWLERAPSRAPSMATVSGITGADAPNDDNSVAQLLGHLDEMNQLQVLTLDLRVFGDASAKAVAALSKLRILIVNDAAALTDDGLAAIAECKKLEVLDLGVGHRTTADGLRHLASLPHLEVLWLPENVDRQAIHDLQRHMPKVKIEVGGEPFVADK